MTAPEDDQVDVVDEAPARGLTARQVEYLLRPIGRRRVLQHRGNSHLSQQDVRAHLARVFGWGGWSYAILQHDVVEVLQVRNSNGNEAWEVTYLCRLRLTIRDPRGNELASFDDVGTGTSPKLPSKGDAHDFAAKVAVSIALKRAAANLGDQFGLSLYNKGQVEALTVFTLGHDDLAPGKETDDEQLPEQQALGHDDEGSQDPGDQPARQDSQEGQGGPPAAPRSPAPSTPAAVHLGPNATAPDYLAALRTVDTEAAVVGLKRDAGLAGLLEHEVTIPGRNGNPPQQVSLGQAFDVRLDWVVRANARPKG